MAFEIGKIQTVVGTGEEGYAGDGGPATQALIGEAYGCDFDQIRAPGLHAINQVRAAATHSDPPDAHAVISAQ